MTTIQKRLISLVVILGVCGAIWWLWPADKLKQTSTKSDEKVRTPDTSLTPAQQVQLREAVTELETKKKQGDDEGILAATKKIASAIGGKAGAMLNMAASRNVRVNFYGRVVDQHGRGVAGARVDMVIGGGGSMAPGTGLTYFTTDADGYFEVKAKGQGVSIGGVRHPNLALVYFSNRHDGQKERAMHLEATNQWGKKSNWHSYEKRSKPLVIRVWRVEKFEAVKSGGGAYHVPVNGENTIVNKTLKVTCQRSEMNDYFDYGNWSITLQPVGGGIRETNDLYLNEAPVSGYSPEITVTMNKADSGYQHRIHPARHYYYYAKDGKTYGSLEISFEPFSKKKSCILMTKFKLNTNGTRNLAVRRR